MKRYNNVKIDSSKKIENGLGTWTVFIGLSILCHIIFLSALVYGQLPMPEKKAVLPSVINIDLISLPLSRASQFPATTNKRFSHKKVKSVFHKKTIKKEFIKRKKVSLKIKPKPIEKKEIIVKAKSKPIEKKKVIVKAKPKFIEKKKVIAKPKPVKEKKVSSIKTTPPVKQDKKSVPVEKIAKSLVRDEQVAIKPKKSMKSKTYDSSKIMESLRKNMKQKVQESEDEYFNKVFSRLSVNTKERKLNTNDINKGGSRASDGKKTSEVIKQYQMELYHHVQKNWAFFERLTNNKKELVVDILITIMVDGKISSISYKKKSGNRYLDNSAYNAVVKSNPLPALPNGYSPYSIVLGFTPSGLK